MVHGSMLMLKMGIFSKKKIIEKSVDITETKKAVVEHLPDVDQLVLDYVNASNTDYAIMLKGAWGVGKTFYWNKSLSQDIEQIDSPFKVQDKFVKYKPIRISLFGIENLNSLIMRITRAKYLGDNKWLNAATSVVASGVKSFAKKYDIESDELESLVRTMKDVDQKRFVFCFDDLERLEEGLLLEALGYINTMVENDSLKVVILCNEEELTKNLSEDSKYPAYKEKLIRFTFQMSTDIDKVLDALLEGKEEGFKSYIVSSRSYIVDFYKKGECDNIRTLKFNIETYQQLYSIMCEMELQGFSEHIKKHYLMLSMLYAIEYKNGAKDEELQDLIELTSETTYALDFEIDSFNRLAGIENQKDAKEPSYREKVKQRYFNSSPAKIGSSSSFLDYMKTGRLDKTQLAEDVRHTLAVLQNKELTEEQQLLTTLNNVWVLDDQLLGDTVNALLEKARKGELSLDLYPAAFSSINTLIANNFLKGPDTAELNKIFNLGIRRAKPRTVYSDKFESEYHAMSFKLDKDSQAIADIVLQIYRELGEKEGIKIFQESLQRLWSEPLDMKDFSVSHYPLLASLKPVEVVKVFTAADNFGKQRFVMFLQTRVEYAYTAVPEEATFLTPFKALCEKHLQGAYKPSIMMKYMKYISDFLTRYGY